MTNYTFDGMVDRITKDLALANNKVQVQDGDFSNDLTAMAKMAHKIASKVVMNYHTYYHIAGFTDTITRVDWHYLGEGKFQREQTAVK